MKTKVILCTYPSLYAESVFKPLLEAPDIEIVAVISSTRLLKKGYGFLRSAFTMLKQSGWRYVGYHMWLTDVFELVQPFVSRKTVKRLCRDADIPLHETSDINSAASVEFIRSKQADLLVSAYFNQLVQQEVRELPRYGAINIHPSMLPEFRGTDPVFHALLSDRQEIGVTVHYMNEGLDTGNILRQVGIEVRPDASMLLYYDALFKRGARLLIEVLPQIRIGWPGMLQEGGGNYASWPDRCHVSLFRRQGLRLMSLREYLALLST